MSLFALFLTDYEPLRLLDHAHSGDVSMFLSYWYPRKVVGASATGAKSQMASLDKLFVWLGQTGRLPPAAVAAAAAGLRANRALFLAKYVRG